MSCDRTVQTPSDYRSDPEGVLQGVQHAGLWLSFDGLRTGLEKVYENAMVLELEKMGLKVVSQAPIQVFYEGHVVGEYCADLLVEDAVIVELKAVRALAAEHEAQLLNYLKATRYEVGLLLNFGPKPQVKRKVYDNERKGNLSWVENE